MLHIILLILKIIGIVLLCILGILILSIVCALFVPVRYQIRLNREEGEDKPPFTAYAKVTWLLHLVNIRLRYPADVIVRVRILFFTLFRIPGIEKTGDKKTAKAGKSKTKKDHTESRKQTEAEENVKQINRKAEESVLGNDISESDTDNNFEAFETFDSGYNEIENPLNPKQKTEALEEPEQPDDLAGQEADADKKKKESPLDKIRKIIDKIKQFVIKIKKLFENIQYTIRKFCDKIKSALDNIEYYREVLESEPFKESLQLCKGELKSVFKAIKPDKFEANITVGMDDPATTGQILAIYGILYPLIGRNVQVIGDFERTHIEGNIYICGRIRAFTFIRTAIRVYFNKDIKKLIKLLKKEAV